MGNDAAEKTEEAVQEACWKSGLRNGKKPSLVMKLGSFNALRVRKQPAADSPAMLKSIFSLARNRSATSSFCSKPTAVTRRLV
jgi:hypothetical protein